MPYTSYLASAFQNASDQISALNPHRSTEAHDYFFSLPDAAARAEYIRKTEVFVLRIRTINAFLTDLLFFTKCLENIRIKYDLARSDQSLLLQGHPKFLDPVPTLSRAFSDGIHGFVRALRDDLKIVSAAEMNARYDELEFIALLRNAFVHHPFGNQPTDILGASVISSDPHILPFSYIGPGGGGWAYMSTYYESQMTDANFKMLQPEQQLQRNRVALLAAGGWRDVAQNAESRAQIKTYGLPLVDQEKAAGQFSSLFNDKILPFLRSETIQARADHIIP